MLIKWPTAEPQGGFYCQSIAQKKTRKKKNMIILIHFKLTEQVGAATVRGCGGFVQHEIWLLYWGKFVWLHTKGNHQLLFFCVSHCCQIRQKTEILRITALIENKSCCEYNVRVFFFFFHLWHVFLCVSTCRGWGCGTNLQRGGQYAEAMQTVIELRVGGPAQERLPELRLAFGLRPAT